jgi:hypothetical protein
MRPLLQIAALRLDVSYAISRKPSMRQCKTTSREAVKRRQLVRPKTPPSEIVVDEQRSRSLEIRRYLPRGAFGSAIPSQTNRGCLAICPLICTPIDPSCAAAGAKAEICFSLLLFLKSLPVSVQIALS